jgi:hypothetical protein
MIKYQREYEKFIIERGVGSNDKVGDSIKAYISYLNMVSKHLNKDINPKTLNSMKDLELLSAQLTGKVSLKTIKNYGSAMKQYIKMVSKLNLD